MREHRSNFLSYILFDSLESIRFGLNTLKCTNCTLYPSIFTAMTTIPSILRIGPLPGELIIDSVAICPQERYCAWLRFPANRVDTLELLCPCLHAEGLRPLKGLTEGATSTMKFSHGNAVSIFNILHFI